MARILVAENNQSIAAYVSGLLKKSCHRVEMVDNSLDAWRASGTENYDILILSASMPGIDGFVLAQRALQENPSLQVIFVTGFSAVAMDTGKTPFYAPQPFTTRPFHLADLGLHVNALAGFAQVQEEEQKISGTVVYPDFTRKSALRPEASVQQEIAN